MITLATTSNGDAAGATLGLVLIGGFLFMAWALPMILAHTIGKKKHLSAPILWGLFLGWIGVLIVLIMSPRKSAHDLAFEAWERNSRVAALAGQDMKDWVAANPPPVDGRPVNGQIQFQQQR